tara:strand:- start:122 stop:304 length:183 start_codon:yes stop_codon:yes gene_type:complete
MRKKIEILAETPLDLATLVFGFCGYDGRRDLSDPVCTGYCDDIQRGAPLIAYGLILLTIR